MASAHFKTTLDFFHQSGPVGRSPAKMESELDRNEENEVLVSPNFRKEDSSPRITFRRRLTTTEKKVSVGEASAVEELINQGSPEPTATRHLKQSVISSQVSQMSSSSKQFGRVAHKRNKAKL